MKTRKADWKAYFQLIHRANIPLLVLLGYFLVQLVYSRISTDLVPFASKIYTGEILDTAQIGQYVLLVAVMIAIWLVQNLFQYWFTYRTDRQFQLVTWQSMVHLPMAALDKQNAATLPSRVTSDSTKLSMQFLQMVGVLTSVYTIYVTLSNVRKDSAFMAGFMLKMLGVLLLWIILSSVVCGRFKFRASLRFQETYAAFTDYITERLSNIPLIKSSAAEETEVIRAVKEIDGQYHAEIHQINVEYITTFISQSCMYIFQALVLLTGAVMVRSGTLDQAGMLTAYRYSLTLPVYLITIMNAYLTVKESQGCADRISEIVAAEPERCQRKKAFAMEDADITFENVTFRYGEKRGLCSASFTIPANRVTAIVGPNGSGKSTLMNVLSGIYPYGTYEGNIIYNGEICKFNTIKDSEEKGIVIIHQELALIPYMTIGENMYLGNERGKSFSINWNETYGEADKYLKIVGLEESSRTLIKDIGVGKQQLVEIAKALAKNAKLLILDEPTASLNEDDSQALLDLLLKFKEQGMTSIIISHKLNEISYVADKITVIRDGSTIETMDKKVDDFSENRIIRGMVGRELSNRFPARENVKIGDVCMEVKNWTVHHPLTPAKKVVDDVSFYVRRGEVVGISGLMGAGRTELAMSLFGRSYGTGISGTLRMNGKEVHLKNVRQAIDHKLAYVTEDRKGNGLILSNPIYTNTSLAKMDEVSRFGVIDKLKEVQVAEDYRQKLHTKAPSVYQNVGNLSGGNQQKVLLAKWMLTDPDVLILDEPTRGIDVGAKYEIYCIINDLVAAGKSVIIISSELPEVLGMSDRIYVMNEGKIVGEVDGKEATQEIIMSYIMKSGKGA